MIPEVVVVDHLAVAGAEVVVLGGGETQGVLFRDHGARDGGEVGCGGEVVAAALGVWAMVFLAVTIAGSSLLLGKKMGALFRA